MKATELNIGSKIHFDEASYLGALARVRDICDRINRAVCVLTSNDIEVDYFPLNEADVLRLAKAHADKESKKAGKLPKSILNNLWNDLYDEAIKAYAELLNSYKCYYGSQYADRLSYVDGKAAIPESLRSSIESEHTVLIENDKQLQYARLLSQWQALKGEFASIGVDVAKLPQKEDNTNNGYFDYSVWDSLN